MRRFLVAAAVGLPLVLGTPAHPADPDDKAEAAAVRAEAAADRAEAAARRVEDAAARLERAIDAIERREHPGTKPAADR
jgi:hypothetical protein